jgi:hypothetical protein
MTGADFDSDETMLGADGARELHNDLCALCHLKGTAGTGITDASQMGGD